MNKVTVQRWIIYIIAINLLAMGIILNTRTNLGVACFSSLYYAISQVFNISLGTSSIILYFILIGVQLILTRKITIPLILEIPFSLVFGYLTDFYDAIITIKPQNTLQAYLLLALALIVISYGVYFSVRSNLVVTPVEATVNTIAEVFKLNFSLVKNCFDISMLGFTCVFCFVMNSPLYGIGPGTVISALLLGRIISIHQRIFDKKMQIFQVCQDN
ncbi:DUF6198 family protein [Thomasclavelia sp.]|uniref:YczE/YyaS/YitT family protein n=1 Tax=Thomasclavelia sp. TaxID=3025757 RepID=UPI0025E944BC|nr:DUF6198 family protein [Thomasclavelia sp.]